MLTADAYRGFEIAGRIKSGMVHVNGPTVEDSIEAPIGGVRDSGWGRHGGHAREDLDSRDFPVVVAAGAGPAYAAAHGGDLDIPVLITPRDSSIFRAAGVWLFDFKHDYVQSANERSDSMDSHVLIEARKTRMSANRWRRSLIRSSPSLQPGCARSQAG